MDTHHNSLDNGFQVKYISPLNYDSNVFRVDTDESSDFFYTLTPSLVLRSDWDNHSLILSGSGTSGRYFDNISEDFEDMTLSAAGRVNMLVSSNLNGSLSHSHGHEARGSPDDVGGAEASIFSRRPARRACSTAKAKSG